ISKGWELAQFLSEAGQTEDISLQVHDMKEPQGGYIARVCKLKKRRPFHKQQYSSDEEEMPAVCQYCGYRRDHTNIEDCPAYGKTCFKCKKLHHFATVCKENRTTDTASKGKKKRRSRNNIDSVKQTRESDSTENSDDDFLSRSVAHMRIKTLKAEPRTKGRSFNGSLMNFQNKPGAMRCPQYRDRDNATQIRGEIHRWTREIEVKLERKINEAMEDLKQIIQTGMRVDVNGTQGAENNSTNNGQKEKRICTSIRATHEDEQQHAVQVNDRDQHDWWEYTNLQTVKRKHNEYDNARSEESDQSDCDFLDRTVKFKVCAETDYDPGGEDLRESYMIGKTDL
ncbi:MAG: hypothetical protein AB2693_22155, partial [Candidatus Thiodiazotropha sp.]